MKIRTSLGFIAALFLSCMAVHAEKLAWLDDFQAAISQAKATHKNILIDFTGSDWCPVCIVMDKQVFETPKFKEFADKNLVLMQADFPQGKQLPAKVQDQNNQLMKEYGVDGMLPTYILVDKSGKVLGRHLGLLEGGPSAFIAMLEAFKK